MLDSSWGGLGKMLEVAGFLEIGTCSALEVEVEIRQDGEV